MTPKQRFESALVFKQPEGRVPMMELEFQLYEELCHRAPVVGEEFAALSDKERQRALAHNAELMVESARLCGHDAIKDIGGYWELWPGQPALLWLPDEASRLGQIRALRRAAGGEFYIVGSVCATMGIPEGDGFEDFVVDLFDNPDDVLARNEQVLQGALALQDKMLEAGADGIINACDVAFNSGTFISPAMMDTFFFPFFSRWVEGVHRSGALAIWHTDGNISAVLNRVLASGLDAIQCVDPMAGMDIIALKKQLYGRLALIGNLDCGLLHSGPADEITRQARALLEGCKDGGGFVLGGCNAIFKGIPLAHYRAFLAARDEYGSY